jgi:hypothetical protein
MAGVSLYDQPRLTNKYVVLARWSFVKKNAKYYDDCSALLRKYIIRMLHDTCAPACILTCGNLCSQEPVPTTVSVVPRP